MLKNIPDLPKLLRYIRSEINEILHPEEQKTIMESHIATGANRVFLGSCEDQYKERRRHPVDTKVKGPNVIIQ